VTDLELAEQAARTAADLLVGRFRRPARGIESKSSATDLVSDADRAAERAIAELLRHERPDDAMLGEEGADATGSSGRRWVVDPLDGTTNFLYGYPAWCVSVAPEDGTGPVVGGIRDPPSQETFRAAGMLLVTEAGGAVTGLAGEPPGIAAAGPRLAEQLAELVGGAAGRPALAEQ